VNRVTPHQVVRLLRRAGFSGWKNPARKGPGAPGFRVREVRAAGMAFAERDAHLVILGWPD